MRSLLTACLLAAATAVQSTAQVATGSDEVVVVEPLRVTPVSVLDERRRAMTGWPDSEDWQDGSRFQVILHLSGDRIRNITRLGQPIVEALIDDKGRNLWDATRYSIAARETTTPVTLLPMFANQGWYPLQLDFPAIPRDSERIAVLRGYINIVFGEGDFPIYIKNIRSLIGTGELQHPELERHGIRIKLHHPNDLPMKVSDNILFAAEFISGEFNVRRLGAFDGWLRNMALRFSRGRGEIDGNPIELYAAQRGTFDSDTELVIYVFEHVEPVRVEWEFIDEIDIP